MTKLIILICGLSLVGWVQAADTDILECIVCESSDPANACFTNPDQYTQNCPSKFGCFSSIGKYVHT